MNVGCINTDRCLISMRNHTGKTELCFEHVFKSTHSFILKFKILLIVHFTLSFVAKIAWELSLENE